MDVKDIISIIENYINRYSIICLDTIHIDTKYISTISTNNMTINLLSHSKNSFIQIYCGDNDCTMEYSRWPIMMYCFMWPGDVGYFEYIKRLNNLCDEYTIINKIMSLYRSYKDDFAKIYNLR
jgi:hypothetical protein